MTNSKFDKFINQETKTAPLDATVRLDEWQRQVSGFYKEIETFLAPYLVKKKMERRYVTKEVVEEGVGSYEIESLLITFGRHTLKFDPVGMNIVGACGRIDMIGPQGTVKFLLVESAPVKGTVASATAKKAAAKPRQIKATEKNAWKIATTYPKVELLPVTAESFFDAVMEITNG